MLIAHLSDPHFGSVTYHPSQFLSKRWLGNLNLALFRRSSHLFAPLLQLPDLFENLGVDFAFITGDFTSTSLEEEFIKAKKYLDSFKTPYCILPGNHDCYTKDTPKKRALYNFFHPEKIQVKKLKKNWYWIGLDCALATPYFCSFGKFSQTLEDELQKTLESLPSDCQIIMGNHFPLFRSQGLRHDLHRKEHLQSLLKSFPQVKLYLHGHDHKPYIIDRRDQGLPLVLNSGSVSSRKHGGFYLIELAHKALLHHYLWNGASWGKSSSKILWDTTDKM